MWSNILWNNISRLNLFFYVKKDVDKTPRIIPGDRAIFYRTSEGVRHTQYLCRAMWKQRWEPCHISLYGGVQFLLVEERTQIQCIREETTDLPQVNWQTFSHNVRHGGPGGGITPRDRRFFDPKFYRIILFDQRGSGKSMPAAELRENTTWNSVADMEKIREHYGIKKWVVFGGSWGATLSLAYAQSHPDRVKALILRGIFTLRRRELLWFYQDGASLLFPDKWEHYVKPIPEVERGDIMNAYYRRLTSDDEETRIKAAKGWSIWEMATVRLFEDEEMLKRAEGDNWALQRARIECHFFVNGGFMKKDGQLLDDIDKIRHIPCTILQGRYDVICPMETAWLLHRKWPEADFHIVQDAGHSNKEPGITSLLLDATDKYKNV